MKHRTLVVAGLLAIVATAAGVVAGGEVGSFLLAGVEVGPFLVLAVLAQVGQKRRWARVLTYLWLCVMVLGFSLLVMGLVAVARTTSASPDTSAELADGGARVALALLGGLALSATLLFRDARRVVARFLPIDPDSLVHKAALVILVFLTVASLGQLAALGGQPVYLTFAERVPAEALNGGRSATGQILDMFYTLAWMIPVAVVAAGYPLRRSLGAAMGRLGFTRPTRRQVLAGLALAAALVAVFSGVDQLIGTLWALMGWTATDEAAFKRLMGAGMSAVGAVAVGITAGIGEEVAVRGLLQPRLGKVLPNLAFTAGHALQYGPDALISVFLLGMVLAFVRARSSTTVAAVVHGTYDFLSIALGLIGF